MQAWQVDMPPGAPIDLSVNLSSKQFMQPDIVEQIKAALGEAKDLGIRFSMDDFGTGYSSLSYLHKLPIDTLKIDRSFVMDLGVRNEVHEIVRTIITLAHNLHMQVVAEGVETPEQVSMLQKLGCEYAQGFHFSKPVGGAEISDLLRTDTRFL